MCTHTRRLGAVTGLCALLVLSGCGAREGGTTPDEPAGPRVDPIAGEYLSDSVPGDPFATDPAVVLRLKLADGEIRFSADCNTFLGTASWQDGRFDAGNLGGTEMGCSPQRHARDEWLVDFFSHADRIEESGDDIAIHRGSTTIWFVPAREVAGQRAAVPLEGTHWELTTIGEYGADHGSMSSLPAGWFASLEVAGGRVSFDDGCNTGGGAVRVDGESLRFSDPVRTLKACAGAGEQVQRAMARMLEGEVAWSISGRELRLRKGGHELVFTAPSQSAGD